MKALFELLDDLRESGTMNMFGAPRWLLDNGLVDSKEEAREVFQAWTETKNKEALTHV
mgnify:FL=1